MSLSIITTEHYLDSRGNCSIIDITELINRFISGEKFSEGNVTVFVPGATGAVSAVEYEPGLLKDLPRFFEKIIPADDHYHHEMTWHDDNGHSHVRATLIKPSLTVPFSDGKLMTGTWQQIVVLDFDTKPRRRRIILQAIGLRYD